MIAELDKSEFEKARSVYAGLENCVAATAVIEGNTPGRIFVDNSENPAAAFMWNEFRYGFLAGNPDNSEFIESLSRLLTETLLPEAKNSHDPTLLLYPYPESWREKIDVLVRGHSPLHLARSMFTFNPSKFTHQGWRERIPAGFDIRRVDESLAKKPAVAGELDFLWTSRDNFLSKGVGFCLLRGEEIVSLCYSVFAAGQKREISVYTDSQYREKGFATLTVAAYIDHCQQNGLSPVWQCWGNNAPSRALAAKLGFEHVVDYPVYLIDLNKKEEQAG